MHIRPVTYGKKEKWMLLKDEGIVTECHWMVTWNVTQNGAFQFSRNGGVSSSV